MCNIPERRLMPKNPLDGQIPVWVQSQGRWVAQNPGAGPGGGFDPSENQDITGNYSFSETITYKFNAVTPTAPGTGYKQYAGNTNHITYLFSNGFRYSYDYSNLSGNRVLTIPNANGTIALVDTGNLRIDSPLDGTLRNVIDHAGTQSPLQVSTTLVQAGKIRFNNGVLYRDVNDSTGLRLFGGTLTTTNDSGYIHMQRDTTNFGAPIFGLANGNFDSNYFRWERNGTELARLTATGNWYMGSGGITPTARLQVRGDGSNPIQRWQNNVGSNLADFTNTGLINFLATDTGISYSNSSIKFIDSLGTIDYSNMNGSNLAYHRFRAPSWATAGDQKIIGIETTYSAPAGNANFRPLSITYTISNSGAQTGTLSGIYLNAVEGSLNGITHNLIDLQRDGVSRFKVTRTGVLTASSDIYSDASIYATAGGYVGWAGRSLMRSITDSNIILYNSTATNFGILQFGGTTDTFPGLKRVGGGIRVVAADDSRFADIEAREYSASTGFFAPNSTEVRGTYIRGRGNTFLTFGDGTPGMLIENTNGTLSNSAIFQLNSRTKGFLPPRLTQSERNGIATPANGLNVFNEESNRPEFYTNKWEGSYLTGRDLIPDDDNTYYLGKNSNSDPKGFKGVIVKDAVNNNPYRIEVSNGILRATELT